MRSSLSRVAANRWWSSRGRSRYSSLRSSITPPLEVFPEVELSMLQEIDTLVGGPVTDRERCQSYAGLVFQVGTMIEDRLNKELTPEQSDLLWKELHDNRTDQFYELVGPVMDEIVDLLFPELAP